MDSDTDLAMTLIWHDKCLRYRLNAYTKKDVMKCNLSGFQAPAQSLMMFAKASSWCPGLVSSQYMTSEVEEIESIRTSLLLAFKRE